MLVVFDCWLRATSQLSCVDMHEGLVFFSAEQLDMPDGIVGVASTTPKREREHDHQLAADSRNESHHNKTINQSIR